MSATTLPDLRLILARCERELAAWHPDPDDGAEFARLHENASRARLAVKDAEAGHVPTRPMLLPRASFTWRDLGWPGIALFVALAAMLFAKKH